MKQRETPRRSWDHPRIQQNLQEKVEPIDARIASLTKIRVLIQKQIAHCREMETQQKGARIVGGEPDALGQAHRPVCAGEWIVWVLGYGGLVLGYEGSGSFIDMDGVPMRGEDGRQLA